MQTLQTAERFDAFLLGIPPHDDSWWKAVTLPDPWIGRTPRVNAGAWYRLRFELPDKGDQNYILFVRRLSGTWMEFHLNGQPLTSDYVHPTSGARLAVPLVVRVPYERLRPGVNTLHVKLVADPAFLDGMPRMRIGTAMELGQQVRYWRFLQNDIIPIFAFALALVGLLALAFWAVDRSDILFWYGFAGVAFGFVVASWYVATGYPGFRWWVLSLVFLLYYGVVTPLAIVHLRLTGWRVPWLEGLLWGLLVLAAVMIGSSNLTIRIAAWNGFGLFYSILPLLLLVPIARSRQAVRPISRIGLAVAGVGASALSLHDWAARIGVLPHDQPLLILFVVPLFMFAIGAVMFERYLTSMRRQRELTIDLEARVVQKTREIEAAHAQMRAVDEERALLRERRRIMADMHDGLGARLVGLLSQVQSGRADPRQIEEGLAAALEELRTTIDSLQPVEGDLGVVLGNVRHRMRTVFDTAGVELGWRVGELPRMDDLTPARNLAIQRILLELFTNVLKHSGARKVDVSTHAGAGRASIVIEDDGRGFEVANRRNGRGLANLQERAREAGGSLLIESEPGRGTRATLALPAAA